MCFPVPTARRTAGEKEPAYPQPDCITLCKEVADTRPGFTLFADAADGGRASVRLTRYAPSGEMVWKITQLSP